MSGNGGFSFRYESKELKDSFDEYCSENRVSRNGLLNKLLKEFLENISHVSKKVEDK